MKSIPKLKTVVKEKLFRPFNRIFERAIIRTASHKE
jgi:hypothetical protein